VDQRGDAAFGNHEVARLGALHLDVRPRGVEVVVVRHDEAGLQDRMKEDAFGRAALVGGDDVLEAGQVAHDRLEPVEGAAAGVRLVALHQRAPLRRRHRAGPRVCQQVDQDVLGAQAEDVAAGGEEGRLPVLAARELHGLDRLDAERLDYCAEIHGGRTVSSGSTECQERAGHAPCAPSCTVVQLVLRAPS
jgi:hypothetical protein